MALKTRTRMCRTCQPARSKKAKAAEAIAAAMSTSTSTVAGALLVVATDSAEAAQPVALDVPHHVVLEVFSYLPPRAIVRARCVARAFVRDAPALVNYLECSTHQRFPAATTMNLFPRMTEVHLDGGNSLVEEAAPGLARCGALRRLTIVRGLPEQAPLAGGTTAILCGLQLSDLDIRRVRIEVPAGVAMPAWRTLGTLILRDTGIGDAALANLVGSLTGTVLPLRRLDLSRNPFGELEGMRPLAEALGAFRDLETLELTADRISDSGAKRLLGALLEGSCPRLTMLEMSLNFLGNDFMDFLAEGLLREGHGLQLLRKVGIGGRFMPAHGVSNFNSLGRSLAAGGLPHLNFLHVQGDVGPAQVGPLLRELRSESCPDLSIVKVERSTRYHPDDDPAAVEDAIESMWELVTCASKPDLQQVHVLGMNLGKGLETGFAPEEDTTFYRATNMSSFHRLAAAGALRGVMIYV